MMKRVWILSVILPALLPAALQRIEVSERSDVLDGKSFGAAGPYERITGKAYFAVDPNLPANKIITDIAKAPRNATGLVEFSADFYCLKPRDPKNGNHALLFEVSNRGGKGMLGTFDFGGSLDPRTQADFGDNFLLEQGYTLVWLGWEFDVPPGTRHAPALCARCQGHHRPGTFRNHRRSRLHPPIARRSQCPGVSGLEPRRPRAGPHRARLSRWQTHAAAARCLAYRRRHPHRPAARLRSRPHLRTGLPVAGSAARRPRPRRRPRLHLLL